MTASQRDPWKRRQAFSLFWASHGLQLVNTQWHRGQRTPGPRRLLDLPLRIAPRSVPFSWPACPTPKRLVWFFILGSSLPWPTPALPVHSFLFLSPALHPWLSASGPASKGWMLLLPPSLPLWGYDSSLPSVSPWSQLWAAAGHRIYFTTSHMVWFPLMGILGLGGCRAEKHRLPFRKGRHEFTPVLPLICMQNWQRAMMRIHDDSLHQVSVQSRWLISPCFIMS